MNILGLDTCFDACSVALVRADEGCVASRFEPMATGHAERLIPMIGEVMAEAGLDFAALDRIAVTYGPGTFTGTRIALAAARSLGLATGKPIVGATSLWVMAEGVAREFCDENSGAAADDRPAHFPDILIATDARRDEVYVQHFSRGAPLGDPAVLSPLQVAQRLPQGCTVIVAGSGAEAVAAAAGNRQSIDLRVIRPDLLPDARFLASLALRLDSAPRPVSPLYLRPADAKPQAGKSIPRAIT
ncbi:MAG: tRNA (adenosine(37)-N6)-threonylcarbamoyltransferase complex dimerization subunit type 1 TsaB [Alphaproteobacteria bacterium]|nr:tRNA (adenosine(37)-N6)-threonylcarbamoyltransferase complex dimerization subunit type 1 TsaB [Alphaproteobacteria bacterium]